MHIGINTMHASVLVAAFLALSCEAYDCSYGCPLKGTPVCDSNGIRYANDCIATCQNVVAGTCVGGQSRFNAPESDDETLVSLAVMTRYKGYAYVGRHSQGRLTSSRSSVEVEEPQLDPDEEWEELTGSQIARKIALDGHEYWARVPSHARHLRAQPQSKVQHSREMIVIGTDSRVEIQDATGMPNSIIASIDYTSHSGCTATMVSPWAAVTAGHCVHYQGSFLPVSHVAPGRHRDASGTVQEPFGSWEVDSVTMLAQWTYSGNPRHDIAVLTLRPRMVDGLCQHAGDVSGYGDIGMAIDGALLSSVSISGYPSDKDYGTLMTSGICHEIYPWSMDGNMGRHSCDTVAGMSGSSFLTPDNVVVGVHAYGSANQNSGPLFVGINYDAVSAWVGDEPEKQCGVQEGEPLLNVDSSLHEPSSTGKQCNRSVLRLASGCK